MSYILDALKKSEKERALGNVPTLEASDQQEERRVPMRWLLLTVVCLVVALVIAGGWMLWPSGPVNRPSVSANAVPGTDPEAAAPRTAESAQSAQTGNAPAPETPALPVSINAVDASVRSRIPDFRINVLSYSDNNAKRFVMIGQNIFKEGEEVAAGVVVQEIRNSEVVFEFENVRFILVP